MLNPLKVAALGVAAVMAAGTASADAISTNVWYEFGFDGVGTSLTGGSGTIPLADPAATSVGNPAWTFTLTRPGTLFVTDAFESGDRFEILDFGTVIGRTSGPNVGSQCGSDLSCALADPDFSSGSFLLGAGSHSISGTLLQTIAPGAGAFIVNVSAVPLPAAATMLLTALAALGGLALRGKRQAA